MTTVFYELAVDSWLSTETIVISSPTGRVVASFPIPFVQRGGDDRWLYVLNTLEHLIERRNGVRCWHIEHQDGQAVNPDLPPVHGEYLLVEDGESCNSSPGQVGDLPLCLRHRSCRRAHLYPRSRVLSPTSCAESGGELVH